MDWKEQFEERFAGVIGHPLHAKIPMENFISTEIIEKLIKEIPDLMDCKNADQYDEMKDFKQQLRDKWLANRNVPEPQNSSRS